MINTRRSFIPFAFLSSMFALIVVRLFFVQVWNHGVLSSKVNRMVFRERQEEPCRGMILDRQGRTLAMSVRTYTVFVDPKMASGDEADVSRKLAGLGIDVTAERIRAAGGTSYLPLARGVDQDTVQRIRALGLNCVGFTPQYRRSYPEGRLASHVLGVVGREGRGLEGIELQAEKFLSGEEVSGLAYRDGRGRMIAHRLVDPEELNGATVRLTVDRTLQFIAEQEIEEACRKWIPRRAMVVIQDPGTGEILAMASRPDFDPSRPGPSWKHLRNPVVSDVFEPGSTFKFITAAAALQEGVVRRTETIFCENGKYPVFGHTIKDHEKQGEITFDEVMEYSSNIGIAKVAERLGGERLYRYARLFGFYSTTGVDLPGEIRGLLRPTEEWSGLSLPVISFGQEIGVTALQMVNAYSAIANGGTLLQPRIVDSVTSAAGETLYEGEKRVIRKTVSPEIAGQLREMMVRVVESGTGRAARVPGYTVGGKTGTAQKRDPETGRYSSSSYVASFCGIVPAESPRLTIFVVVDEPKGGYYASEVAAPVFSRIASRAARYLEIPPDRDSMQLAACRDYASVMERWK